MKKEKKHMSEEKPSLFQVCYLFFYMGLTTFGGAASMLVCLQRELVEKRGWLTEDELYDDVAVAQCSPGIIMVNMATLFGRQTYGFWGSILTTLSLLVAPFTFIAILTLVLNKLSLDMALLASIYGGIRAALCGISVIACIKMFKKNIVDFFTFLVAVLAFVLIVILNVKTIFVIIMGIVIGLVASFVKSKIDDKKQGVKNGD